MLGHLADAAAILCLRGRRLTVRRDGLRKVGCWLTLCCYLVATLGLPVTTLPAAEFRTVRKQAGCGCSARDQRDATCCCTSKAAAKQPKKGCCGRKESNSLEQVQASPACDTDAVQEGPHLNTRNAAGRPDLQHPCEAPGHPSLSPVEPPSARTATCCGTNEPTPDRRDCCVTGQSPPEEYPALTSCGCGRDGVPGLALCADPRIGAAMQPLTRLRLVPDRALVEDAKAVGSALPPPTPPPESAAC